MAVREPGWAAGALSYVSHRKLAHAKGPGTLRARVQRVLPLATVRLGQTILLTPWQPGTGSFLALRAKQELLLATTLLFEALSRRVKVFFQRVRSLQRQWRRAATRSAASITHALPAPWISRQHREGFFRFGGSAKDLLSKGKRLEAELDVRAAAKCYQEATQQKPRDFEVWSLLSKATSDLTYLDEIQGKHREHLTDTDKREFNTKAMEHAKKAIELNPGAFLPHVAACISMGRLALFSDNRSKCQLAKDARQHAVRAVELGPKSDLTHHLMGRWHYEMAQLNMVVRTLIRVAFGTNLPPGTHQDALQCYQRAAELDPACVAHRVEIGRCQVRLGRRAEAIETLKHALTLDWDDINTHLEKIEGEKILKNLDGGWMPRWPLGNLSGAQSSPPTASSQSQQAAGNAA